MCGIVGYIGERKAQDVLLKGLHRLEYRGYDSAGVAILDNSTLEIRKRAGKLSVLEETLARKPIDGKIGIGHTRWATHGEPTTVNAHPHWDCKSRLAIVHNGIIENYEELKEALIREGHHFRSQTDTEVLVHLIEKYYRGNLEEAVAEALGKARGAYAVACLSKDEPDKLVGARLGSPLIIGVGREENFLASDIPAVLDYTREVVFLNEEEMVILSKEDYKITNLEGRQIARKPTKIEWDISQAEKNGLPHFMLKEIGEQPEAVSKTILGRISNERDMVWLPEIKFTNEELNAFEKIVMISCGTAYHAGLVGKYIFEELLHIPVEVDISSEFRYRNPYVDEKTLVISISQSGETADTLAGIREARRKGARVLSICNVVGSSISRESDVTIYTHAGPEIAVASTKAYTCQLAVLYLLGIYLAQLKGTIDKLQAKNFLSELLAIPQLMERVIKEQEVILECAKKYNHVFGFLYIARAINYPNALEGALKIKEISYIHAEGYAAGEMKHGPIALINDKLPVVCIAPKSKVYEKMLSNIQEIKARRGIIIAIASEGDKLVKHHAEHIIYVPETEEIFSPLLTVIPLQLLAYHIAVKRGCDVDQPKNLAKSVTVE
jgi:glucosamine--fructose-6-phosphate aminotransferase (isomerizing)